MVEYLYFSCYIKLSRGVGLFAYVDIERIIQA